MQFCKHIWKLLILIIDFYIGDDVNITTIIYMSEKKPNELKKKPVVIDVMEYVGEIGSKIANCLVC